MDTIAPLYRLFLRSQTDRGRLIGLGVLGALGIILALVTGNADEPGEATATLLAEYGLGLVAPVSAAWIATSMFGDLLEDRLLVYLWLKPIARWQYAFTAFGAALTILVPLVVVPLILAAVVSGVGADLVRGVGLAGIVVTVAYTGLFTALGLQFRRALWWALAYVLVWENAVARISDGTARLAVRSYGRSILSRATDIDLGLDDRGSVASIIVPLLIAVASVAYIVYRFDRAEID